MNTQSLTTFLKSVGNGLVKYSPQLLTAFGVTSMASATVFAISATPEALDKIEEKKEELGKEELTPKETVEACWKCYIPTAVSLVVGGACIIGANSIHTKRNAALATAYKLSETAFTRYREKVVETIGEKKEQTVREKVAEQQVKDNPVDHHSVIITGNGTTLCMEGMSNQYFESDIETIRQKINDLNERMVNGEDYISLSQLYDELGLPHTEYSDYVGWNVSKQGTIRPDFSATIAKDGRPCIVLSYMVRPERDFDKYGY